MFATLKNKIKEETGNDVQILTRRPSHLLRHQNSFGSTTSINTEYLNTLEQKDAEISSMKIQLKELQLKQTDLLDKLEKLTEDNQRLEKSNAILDESVKVAQVQKELIYDEQDKIQNIQLQEISKLKSLLHFREEEAHDRLAEIRQNQQQIEHLKEENKQLREQESLREDIQDELQKLRHSSHIEKNHFTTTLATLEEENRHLLSKLLIYEDSRLNLTQSHDKDETVKLLNRERKLLEQRLEEAHLHLSDIKSTWSVQNMALETQVSRLSHQVAAETTEKRKALQIKMESIERNKELEFNLEKMQNEITQRDNKIKILGEEIDDLSTTLREIRVDNEEDTAYLKNKVKNSDQEVDELKQRLDVADERLTNQIENSDALIKSMSKQISDQKVQLDEINDKLDSEKQERLTVLLKNAEISQEMAMLKQKIKNDNVETSELADQFKILEIIVAEKEMVIETLKKEIVDLNSVINQQTISLASTENLNKEICDKNKAIKVLKQRVSDFKKTLQHELKTNQSNGTENSDTNNQTVQHPTSQYTNSSQSDYGEKTIIMDDVNFKYLKHVILKFLTSREVEARHLIRAVGTLLHLDQDEEKLLHDTLSFKMSWFGTRPESISR